jgi:hypothetical protein
MGTVLSFTTEAREPQRRRRDAKRKQCEIVIFPGVRIERHELDLGHRLRDSAGSDEFDGIGGNDRPRKTS